MGKTKKVLVVGTTTDYIEILMDRYKDRVLFLTDFQEKIHWNKDWLDLSIEIFSDCEDHRASLKVLKEHLRKYNMELTGVVCFDCESLALASVIAEKFSLPFPEVQSILNCRSKFQSKRIWKKRGVPCPEAAIVEHESEMLAYKKLFNSPVVLKPLSGSGSELVFCCDSLEECHSSFTLIKQKLSEFTKKRMYSSRYFTKEHDPCRFVVVEEFVGGEEYSCDFMLEDNQVTLIRVTKKLISTDATFGTVSAYILPAKLPQGWTEERLRGRLLAAAKAVGLDRTIAMVDFKFYNGEMYILELTPRFGGDCLPTLMKASCGLDIFKVALDFSERKDVQLPQIAKMQTIIGLPIIAQKTGKLARMDVAAVIDDKRVLSVQLKRRPGDMIYLPPVDYELRTLGQIIFKPDPDYSFEDQCRELREKCIIQMEEEYAVR